VNYGGGGVTVRDGDTMYIYKVVVWSWVGEGGGRAGYGWKEKPYQRI
jgi:hypothetical protein